MSDPPKFSFGAPASSGSSTPSLFGSSAAKPASNLFGSQTPSSTSGGSSLFGSTPATSGGQQKSLFGSGATTPSSGGGMTFGGTGGTSNWSFGSQPKKDDDSSKNNTPVSSAAPTAQFGAMAGNLFGGNKGMSGGGGSLFGGQQTPSGASTPSAFGAAGSRPASSGGMFGSSTPATSGASTLFGSGAAQSTAPAGGSNIFGGSGTPKPTTPSGGSGLFGGATPSQPATSSGSTTSLFGAQPTTQSSNAQSIFNSHKPPPTPAGGLFQNLGSPAASSPEESGTSTPQQNKANPLSFSTTPAGPPPQELPKFSFGQPADKAPAASAPGAQKPLFGAVGSNTNASSAPASKPAFSLPGAPASASSQPPASSASTASGLFGNKGPAASTGTAPTQPSGGLSFGQAQKTPAAPTSGGPSALFGGLGQNKDNAASTSTATPASTATSASTFGGLFGGQSSSSATPASTATAAPSLGMFSQSSAPPSSSTPGPAASTAPTAPSLGSSFFNNPSTSAQQPSSTAAAPAAGTNTAAPSSSQAPQQQSRLANKSLDEILTLWSTSLATHQKTFANLAERISKWDRQLVDNSTAISKLYNRCFQAERDTAEVERQLSAVEGAQGDLEMQLAKYESDVDGLMQRAGLSEGEIGGVDAERERTYRTAEACSDRLVDMGGNLSQMIEEINAASSKLSSTQRANGAAEGGREDPLTQIVRVLNGHLAQLQVIDSGAAVLQKKVENAQKEARTLGQRQGLVEDEVEGFYRSYLGRR